MKERLFKRTKPLLAGPWERGLLQNPGAYRL